LAGEYADDVMGCDAMRFCCKVLLIKLEFWQVTSLHN